MRFVNKPTVVIVEDEPALLYSLAFTLRRRDFQVVACSDGSSALEYIRSVQDKGESLDLLITDIQLPGIGGLVLIDEARTLHPLLPVLAITAYGSNLLCAELTRRGIDGFLDKPFSTEDLVNRVRGLVDTTAVRGPILT